ncbi:class I ribonucleotide reductase maintenance protein YfaE [Endozoicomonadaceae bacterium StTr2]
MTHIVKVAEGYSFIPREEQTLLEALEAQDIEVEYQCRQGFCGSCQVKLIDGKIEYTEAPVAFVSEGRILPCCCRASSDIIIEVPMTEIPPATGTDN